MVNFVRAATAAIRMFAAASAKDLIGKPILDLIHPDCHQIALTRIKSIAENGASTTMIEMKYLKLDGTAIDVDTQGTSIAYDGVPAVQVSLRDVTERKRAEAEARTLSRAVEQSPASIVITDKAGNIKFVNPRFVEVTGYTEAEALGGNPRFLKSGITPTETYKDLWKTISEGGEWRGDLCNRRKNGELFWEFAAISGVRGENGEVERYIAVKEDITERKQVEAKLAESEAYLRSVIDNEPECIKIVDAQGLLRQMNPAGLAMIEADSMEQVAGLPVADLLAPEYREGFADMHARVLAGETMQMKFELIGLKGGHRWMETHAVPLQYKGETVQLAVTRDITERRQADAARALIETQLRESQKMDALGTLAGGVAHDFNNALAVIMGNLELVREDVGPGHLALESLDEIGKASRRAKDLVQQILAFGRRQQLDLKVISLVPVVQEAAKLLRATLPAGVSLNVVCAPDTPSVLADASQIEQVLLNLCNNAWHAVQNRQQEGIIEIRLQAHECREDHAQDAGLALTSGKIRPGRYARLAVRDNGSGMDKDTLARIFEPFFTTKPLGKGTGLGLSVVHGIVETHEAGLEVESAPEAGSTFYLYFPAAEAPQRTVLTLVPSLPTAHGQGKRVLFVDDDESIVFLMTRLLERQGYRVSGFTDARAALSAVRAKPNDFDLAVTDYNMPGMSGMDVARALKEIRPDLPVALASGYITDELRAEAPVVGISELIYKPNTVEDLCEAVARLAQTVSAS